MSYGCSDRMCGATDCTTCYPGSRNYVQCIDCGEMCNPERLTTVFNGDQLCPDCLTEYTECDYCGKWWLSDDVKRVPCGDDVCKECMDEYLNADKAECRSDS